MVYALVACTCTYKHTSCCNRGCQGVENKPLFRSSLLSFLLVPFHQSQLQAVCVGGREGGREGGEEEEERYTWGEREGGRHMKSTLAVTSRSPENTHKLMGINIEVLIHVQY